jgi:hypothetical protein
MWERDPIRSFDTTGRAIGFVSNYPVFRKLSGVMDRAINQCELPAIVQLPISGTGEWRGGLERVLCTSFQKNCHTYCHARESGHPAIAIMISQRSAVVSSSTAIKKKSAVLIIVTICENKSPHRDPPTHWIPPSPRMTSFT